jgi:integrase
METTRNANGSKTAGMPNPITPKLNGFQPTFLIRSGFCTIRDFHVLRRTHSSLMEELGVNPKVVADQQGHTLDVHMNVYTQTAMDAKLAAVEQLDAAVMSGNELMFPLMM